MINPGDTKETAVDASTKLGVDRTWLAYDRTLLAWIRTAVSLITFGFTIYKFFQIELSRGAPRSGHLIGPTQFALLMIVIGLAALVMATLSHRAALKALRTQYPGPDRTLARVFAALVSLLGIVALLAVLFRQ
jgi:putative membrane protein